MTEQEVIAYHVEPDFGDDDDEDEEIGL